MIRKCLPVLAALIALAAAPARADDGTTHIQTPASPQPAAVNPLIDEKARAYFTDRVVLDQNGERLRFYSDVLRGRVVVVTLFYTECTGMCPLINAKLAEMQDILGDAMGRDYHFVSVTLDPETDRPEVLKKYAENFSTGKGWRFLTGETKDLEQITYRLGQADDNIAAHNPYIMLGNVPEKKWYKARPNEPAEAIVQRLRFIAGKGAFN